MNSLKPIKLQKVDKHLMKYSSIILIIVLLKYENKTSMNIITTVYFQQLLSNASHTFVYSYYKKIPGKNPTLIYDYLKSYKNVSILGLRYNFAMPQLHWCTSNLPHQHPPFSRQYGNKIVLKITKYTEFDKYAY